MKKLLFFLFLLNCYSISVLAQPNAFLTNDKHRESFEFKYINNLIILPIAINGSPLNFIIDSGSQATLLLEQELVDQLKLKNKKQFHIKGLGNNKDVLTIKSTANTLRLKSILLKNIKVYVPIDADISFASTFGIAIHGMIGYDLLKHFIVKIDYGRKKITFYDPKYYKKAKCRKCEVLPMKILKKRPYININTFPDNTPLTLLIDTGGGDSIWLFEAKNKGITIPNKHFEDFLGRGLNGNIYGKRARIEGLKMGKYTIEKPIVSYPDSTALNIKSQQRLGRDGSIGARILNRFKIILDYPNEQFLFKKNSHFKAPFYYNMSGLSIVYNGERIVAAREENISNELDDNDGGAASVFAVKIEKVVHFKWVKNYMVSHVRKGSPAAQAGLQINDEIYTINGEEVYHYTIGALNDLLFTKKKETIKLKIMRKGVFMNFTLVLKDEL